MIYLESKSHDPYFNLALEEYVFEKLDQNEEYFMLWQNDNTIVVGKYQNTAQEINQEFVDQNHIRVARRLSGGGAVYHDKGNLNFTFIVSEEGHGLQFRQFIQPVIRALAKLGIHAEFTGRNDITIDGKKISGNSQYVKRGRIMHHGCILVDSNLTNVSEALRPKEAKFESKSAKSVASRVTTIHACSPKEITVEIFKKALAEEVLQGSGAREYELSEADLAEIQKLADEKYRTWEWNYGKSGNYNYQKSQKYDFGMVEISAVVKEGVLQEVRIYGDFFGNGEIADLEQALQGEALDENLAGRIADKIDVDHYIHGMAALDLQKQLR